MLRTICAGVEEVLVQGIIGEWLRRKCGVEGGAVFCAECYKYMLLRKYDGRGNTWARKQSVRQALVAEIEVQYDVLMLRQVV